MVLVMIGTPLHTERRGKVMNQLHDKGMREDH